MQARRSVGWPTGSTHDSPAPGRLPSSSRASASLTSCGSPRPRRVGTILAVAKHANARRQIDRVCGWVGQEHCHGSRSASGLARRYGAFAARLRVASGRALSVASDHPCARPAARLPRRVSIGGGHRLVCTHEGHTGQASAWCGACLQRFESRGGGLHGGGGGTGDTARVRVSRVSDAVLAATGLQSLDSRRRGGRARPQAGGPSSGEIVLAGVEGDSAPLDVGRFERKQPVIGIFAPKAVSWPTLIGGHRRLPPRVRRAANCDPLASQPARSGSAPSLAGRPVRNRRVADERRRCPTWRVDATG